eukprot:scaffold1397_cov254-Pinguiococcus_pyrenoidosus.AAC.27
MAHSTSAAFASPSTPPGDTSALRKSLIALPKRSVDGAFAGPLSLAGRGESRASLATSSASPCGSACARGSSDVAAGVPRRRTR